MLMNIGFVLYGIVVYWGICQLFTTYNRKCLSRALFIQTKNKCIWLLFAGRYRGRHRIPQEDWYKLSIMGIGTYISLFPVLLFYICLIFDIKFTWYPNSYFAVAKTSIVILINIMDELLGSLFYRE